MLPPHPSQKIANDDHDEDDDDNDDDDHDDDDHDDGDGRDSVMGLGQPGATEG